MIPRTNNTSHIHAHFDFSNAVNRVDAVVFIAISLAAIIGNSIIFLVYSRHRVLRNTTNVFIISLSASDVMVAVLSIPFTFSVFVCQVLPMEDKGTIANFIYRYLG